MNTKLMIFVLILTAVGCSSVPRTKHSDPVMRIMVDPAGIDAGNYVRIEQALVASGKWTVVDRGQGIAAVKKEQENLHRNEADRYMDKEKFAIWGRMYGVGGVIEAHTQCIEKNAFWGGRKLTCLQTLSIISANTGEIIASVTGKETGDKNEYTIAPEWEDTVEALNDAFPEKYEADKTTKELADYKDVAKEEAVRQKEEVAKTAPKQ